MENPVFLWSFSIAMWNYQRVRSDKLTYHAQLLVSQKCLQTSWAKALLSHHILPKRPRRFMSATQAKRHPEPRSKHPKGPASLSFGRNFRSSLLGNSRTSPFLALLDQTRLFKYPISSQHISALSSLLWFTSFLHHDFHVFHSNLHRWSIRKK